MSGFENNIINATNALIRASMHSPNFLTGVSGWTINKDGSAEFNNLLLRGTFQGNNWVMNSDGLFFYNGPAAAGNLSLAITNSSASGTDPYGNVYQPGGISLIALAGLGNIFNIVDVTGNTLFSIDAQGNESAEIINASDVIVNGSSIVNDIINPMPQGIINRGWSGTPPWPATAITGDTPLIELDAVIPAGRQARFRVLPATILLSVAPTAPTQYVQHIRYTTDGSTPTTASPGFTGHDPMVMTIPVSNLLNYTTPLKEIIIGAGSVDTQYRMLVTSSIQSGSFKYQTFVEAIWEDLGAVGAQFANAATVLGSGSSGGGSKQTYTKTYVATEFASYYGATASYGSGPYGQRSHNASSIYQGCSSGLINGSGDQFSFSRFNYGQIATDLGAGTINWVKLRLTNQHSWYNSGLNAIVGWSSYTGAFGDPFVPGAGTHFAQEVYHMNEGATVTRTMGSWLATAITSGFTSITLGRSADYSTNTDLNNYGYFAGAGNVNTAAMLTINYTK